MPLLAKHRDGSLLFANETALLTLRLSAAELAEAQVTCIQGAEGTSPGEPGSFLLSLNQTLQRRLRAHSSKIELSPGLIREVLLLEPLDPPEGVQLKDLIRLLEQKSDAVQKAANTLLWNHANRKADRWNQSARRLKTRVRELRNGVARLLGISQAEQTRERLDWMPPRLLLADLVLRVRRHLSSKLPIRLHLDHDLAAGERLAQADPVAVAQVVLTGLDLLSENATGGQVWLRATEAGFRLRIVIDGCLLSGADEPPDLSSRQATTRELTPILRAHQATFEVHRDGHGRRKVILTLPTHPDRDAPPDSPGSVLPFPETSGL